MFFASSSLFLFALLEAKFSAVKAAVFDMHLDPVGYVRTDPILDSQCLSGHVHAFYGAKALFPETTYNDLQRVGPLEASGNIVENKSLYWHPAVYRELPGPTYELQETRLGVYYVWDPRDPELQAFPPNFAMIAGGVGKTDERAALSFECEGRGTSSSTFPTSACSTDDEFFIEFKMPNCWNGNLRGSDDSHVAYSLDGGNEIDSPCPPGFKKIPQLWLFVEFPNGYKGGKHIFSDGTDVLHVDYFNGWDDGALQNALTNCLDNQDDFGPTGGTLCPGQFNYKNVQLGLGEDVNYKPPQRFDTSLITDEEVMNVSQLQLGQPKDANGNCHPNDQPKQGGTGNPPPTEPPAASPTHPPQAAPTDPPAASPTEPPEATPTDPPEASPTEPPEEDPSDPPEASPTDPPMDTRTDPPIDVSPEECEGFCVESYYTCEDAIESTCDEENLAVHTDCVSRCKIVHDTFTDEIIACIEECACVEDFHVDDCIDIHGDAFLEDIIDCLDAECQDIDVFDLQDLCFELEEDQCHDEEDICLAVCDMIL